MPSDPEEVSKMMEFAKTSEHSLHSASEASVDSNSLLNSEMAAAGRDLTHTPTKRERRKSPATSFGSDNTSTSAQAPMSPTSSLVDLTFEPTVDMMVNDFDDEATLNEEEALADMESHNAEDEIATLREESEMPIEELLAKYSEMVPSPAASSSRRPASSSSRRRREREPRRQPQPEPEPELEEQTSRAEASQQPSELDDSKEQDALDDFNSVSVQFSEGPTDNDEMPAVLPPEQAKKSHRSHLLDLYPDESFGESSQTMGTLDELESLTPLQTLFDEVEEVEEEEDTDTDSEDVRKMIMVGADYQAEIPQGLSLYGDILPYENEDQLIWEPSQVSEREVEDYLAKVQDTRSMAVALAIEDVAAELGEGQPAAEEAVPTAPPPPAPPLAAAPAVASESESVVKDNEQALHLLVQCGYDFKEALRRKRLNVLPSSDTMSSWSEEECQKFEEGIRKFGKDFVQIRHDQVRTRTMRELVQFYYLWKKSERRDQSFALNDTIDHMDVFINEGGDRAGNGNGSGNGNGNGSGGNSSPHTSSASGSSNGHGEGGEPEAATPPRRATAKSYSIMTGNQAAAGTTPSRKRRGSFALEAEDEGNEDDAAMADN